jgi:predicted ATPase
VTAVLLTGMSGTGKSAVLVELERRGHRVVDTDADDWCEWVVDDTGEPDWVWREDPIAADARTGRPPSLEGRRRDS